MTSCAFALALLAGVQDPLKPEALQGSWKGARFTEGDGKGGDGSVELLLVVQGDRLVVRKASGAAVGEATFVLSADGRRIDAAGTSGGYRGKSYPGILKLEGDVLTWCSAGTAGKNAKRPEAFRADPGSAAYLMVFTRQKP